MIHKCGNARRRTLAAQENKVTTTRNVFHIKQYPDNGEIVFVEDALEIHEGDRFLFFYVDNLTQALDARRRNDGSYRFATWHMTQEASKFDEYFSLPDIFGGLTNQVVDGKRTDMLIAWLKNKPAPEHEVVAKKLFDEMYRDSRDGVHEEMTVQ
jgi:hypothetical protein